MKSFVTESAECDRWLGPAYYRRVAGILFLSAVTATALFIWISQSPAAPAALRVFAISAIHSVAIGLPCALLLPRLGVLVSGWPQARKLVAILVTIFTLTTAGCLLSNALLVLFRLQARETFWTNYAFSWRISIIIALAFGLGSYLYEKLRAELEIAQLQLRTKELEEERTSKLAAEARLSALESRIHPHFLFNTLNSISSLIPEDPKRAEDMVGKLAALLRFSLDANQRPLVPLEQELKIVRDYLEIEKARFAGRLRYTVEAAPEAESARVPPLAIQTLAENCVKHVIAPRREGGDIRIGVGIEDGTLKIAVEDSGPGFRLDDAAPGHGIDNLRARLGVLFGGAAVLSAARENGRAVVSIALPANRS